MEEVGARFAQHTVVGIDTSIFIYHLEDHPQYGTIARSVLRQVASNGPAGVTSTITLMEITVQPLRLGEDQVAEEYLLLLRNFPNLSVVEIDRHAAYRAAQLRATYNLRPADALQTGACQLAGATALVTNDKSLRRVSDVEIIILDDFIP